MEEGEEEMGMMDEQTRREKIIDAVACPTKDCEAPVGSVCVHTVEKYPLGVVHYARSEAWEAQTKQRAVDMFVDDRIVHESRSDAFQEKTEDTGPPVRIEFIDGTGQDYRGSVSVRDGLVTVEARTSSTVQVTMLPLANIRSISMAPRPATLFDD